MGAGRRYLLVSPCRDEAAFIRRTLDSVAAQTVPPTLWVVVDDGSTDDTPAILDDYARRLPWLQVLHRTDRGRRSVGPGVIEAFYAGLDGIDVGAFDYVCKLDMDLDLPRGYFEGLMARMEREPRLGTTSGKPWFHHPDTGQLVPETIGDEVSVGASKFYRVACFREIGGFVREVMWDGIDCHRARMLGWTAESVDDEGLRFLHLRPMGSSQGRGIWAGRVRTGFGQYFMGTSPIFFLASAAYRLFKHPILIGSVAMLWGYFSAAIRRAPRYPDLEFRAFLRRYQHASLFLGKAAASKRLEAARAGVWRAAHGEGDQAMDDHGRVELLGLPFDPVTMRTAVDRCLEWCREPRVPHVVITANASHLCMLRRDPDLSAACAAGDLIVADGMAVVWASRILGVPFPERVAGVDLMQRLLAAGGERGLRVYFLGAKAEVVRKLVSDCATRWPGLVVAGFRDGYFGPELHEAIADEIRAASPHLLFIGMPSPFKETWCERFRGRLGVPVMIGVGGSFDVLAGFVRRAPVGFQRLGLEWLWRLLMEPRKLWRRYLTTNSEFLWRVACARLRGASRVGGATPGRRD